MNLSQVVKNMTVSKPEDFKYNINYYVTQNKCWFHTSDYIADCSAFGKLNNSEKIELLIKRNM